LVAQFLIQPTLLRILPGLHVYTLYDMQDFLGCSLWVGQLHIRAQSEVEEHRVLVDVADVVARVLELGVAYVVAVEDGLDEAALLELALNSVKTVSSTSGVGVPHGLLRHPGGRAEALL
jgi:hypothetical protein